jgi:DNA (cytosine-5)-methyltransferase 1
VIRYATVCSGIEAPSAAWHALGWEAAWFSEIEKFPCELLKQKYPAVPNYGDMTKFTKWPDGTIDLLCGGTPCQSFSVAGLRKGLDDPRGNLMLTYVGIAARYRPRWLVWENVPGVLSSNAGKDFGTLLGSLAELGYGFAYRILDAQYFGVPQRRRRVFVVGYLGDWRRAAAVLFERHSLSRDPAPRRETRQDVTGTLNARASGGGGLGTDFECDGGLVLHSLRGEGFDASEDGTGRGTPLVACAVALRGRQDGATIEIGDNQGFALRASQGGGDKAHVLVPMSPIAFDCKSSGQNGFGVGEIASTMRTNGGGHLAVAFDSTQITSPQNGSNPQPGDPCHTLGKNQHEPAIAFCEKTGAIDASKPRNVAHNMRIRRIMPLECERLQGFADHYTSITINGKPASDSARYKALGNSMAVPVLRWIGERIQQVENV